MPRLKATPFEVTPEGDKQAAESVTLPVELTVPFLMDVVHVVPEQSARDAVEGTGTPRPDLHPDAVETVVDLSKRTVWVDPQEFAMGVRTAYVVTEPVDLVV